MCKPLTWIISLSLLCASMPSQAAGLAEALQAMADGDTAEAIDLLDDLIGPGKALSDQARLLKAQALFQAGQVDKASQVYRRVLKSSGPGTTAVIQARFGLAECLAKQGDFKGAEALFAASLEKLTSPERRRAVAERFIRLGDENLEPAPGKGDPKPSQAESFYRAALEQEIEGELAERVELQVGKTLVEQKRHRDAANWYVAWLDKEERADSKRRAQVALLAGENLVKAGDRMRARKYLRDLLADHPKSAWAAQAAYLLSRTHGMPRPGNGTDLARGLSSLRAYIKAYPKHKKVPEARLELALAPMHLGRQAEAEDALRALIKTSAATGSAKQDGDDDTLATARYQLGLCLMAQGRHADAARAYAEYLKRHPAHKFWAQSRAGIEQAHWLLAERFKREKKWTETAAAYLAFAEGHPAAARAPQALYQAAEAQLKADKADAALVALSTLTGKFATHPFGWKGLLLTGQVLEEHKADVAGARKAYEKAKKPGSPVVSQASIRLEALEQPSLLIKSPENFRTSKRPKITWLVRNIEQVQIRAYRIQAEDFFRDRLGMGSLTSVDIALTEPDRTWKVKVDGYRKFVRIEQEVSLPFDRPGLYLLNLTAEDLEATTAVLVSDLGLTVKTGAGEVFCFVQDLAKKRPWKNARVLIADGQKVLFEGSTDSDGVFRGELPEDQDIERLTAFAIEGGQVAWSRQDGPPTHPPNHRPETGFVLPDRPG
jgi:TolA-binding protein